MNMSRLRVSAFILVALTVVLCIVLFRILPGKHLHIRRSIGTETVVFASKQGHIEDLCWASRNDWLLVLWCFPSDTGDVKKLYLVSAKGSQKKEVASSQDGNLYWVGWSSSGEEFAYFKWTGESASISRRMVCPYRSTIEWSTMNGGAASVYIRKVNHKPTTTLAVLPNVPRDIPFGRLEVGTSEYDKSVIRRVKQYLLHQNIVEVSQEPIVVDVRGAMLCLVSSSHSNILVGLNKQLKGKPTVILKDIDRQTEQLEVPLWLSPDLRKIGFLRGGTLRILFLRDTIPDLLQEKARG